MKGFDLKPVVSAPLSHTLHSVVEGGCLSLWSGHTHTHTQWWVSWTKANTFIFFFFSFVTFLVCLHQQKGWCGSHETIKVLEVCWLCASHAHWLSRKPFSSYSYSISSNCHRFIPMHYCSVSLIVKEIAYHSVCTAQDCAISVGLSLEWPQQLICVVWMCWHLWLCCDFERRGCCKFFTWQHTYPWKPSVYVTLVNGLSVS